MLFFGQQGHRVIAHDRRGHGRSTQTWDGNDMETYAYDLAQLTKKLDLCEAIHVGHSTGGGERHGWNIAKRNEKGLLNPDYCVVAMIDHDGMKAGQDLL